MKRNISVIVTLAWLLLSIQSIYKYYYPSLTIFFPPSLYSEYVSLITAFGFFISISFAFNWILKKSNYLTISLIFILLAFVEISSIITPDESISDSWIRWFHYSWDLGVIILLYLILFIKRKRLDSSNA